MKRMDEDRLYELLPLVYRMRDAAQGEPLKALMRVIGEQVSLVEDNIDQLYNNWFIETCDDWVVPYIGDLVGYQPLNDTAALAAATTHCRRDNILVPRREVANTLRYRRRKGTLAVLELLSRDIAGWPARAVEFFPLLSRTQALNHLQLTQGQTLNLDHSEDLARLGGPFANAAYSVDLRRLQSRHSQGRFNIPSVGLFVWRLGVYSVTKTPAYCLESVAANCFTFSVLGNDSPLYVKPLEETDDSHIADEINLPVPLRRTFFKDWAASLYGENLSLQIWIGKKKPKSPDIEPQKIPLENIEVADLSGWHYKPKRGKVAVDPELGRIAFPHRQMPKNGVWVSYQYGFSAAMGGGEYERKLLQPADALVISVGRTENHKTLNAALGEWHTLKPRHGVIEITDSGVYVEQIQLEFQPGQETLQIRAANRQRPVVRLLDWQTDRPDSFSIIGQSGNRFTLDGIMVAGRSLQIAGDMSQVVLRHCTLVPGWAIDNKCCPQRINEPSLEVFSAKVCVIIDHSILGSVQVLSALVDSDSAAENDQDTPADEANLSRCAGIADGVRLDPIRMCISDSILDATDAELEALGAPGCPVAHAVLTIKRSTVIGQLQAHAIELGENTLFLGRVTVARRQLGCLRFSYVSPSSRTPTRFRCQPDLVIAAVDELALSDSEKNARKNSEVLRVKPRFNSLRFGKPAYCQLSRHCATEISQGADDESEMGAFHNLWQPQRLANLTTRLEEYVPAGMDVGVILAS